MADFRQFNVGDRVHFGEVDLRSDPDKIGIFTYAGVVTKVYQTWNSYVCKPDVGVERLVQADLVCSSAQSLNTVLRAVIAQNKDREARRHNAALARLGKVSQ